jgi:hypothetical protein
MPFSTVAAHDAQNVHSNEQIRASVDSGGRSLSQHSQFGRSCSIGDGFLAKERESSLARAGASTESGMAAEAGAGRARDVERKQMRRDHVAR